MFLKILVLATFLVISEAFFPGDWLTPRKKTVVIYPAPRREKLDEAEMAEFLQRQGHEIFEFGRKIGGNAANICRWNYATLTDGQKRSCSCLAVMGFLNEGTGDPFSEGFSIFTKIWYEFSQPGGPHAACLRRDPNNVFKDSRAGYVSRYI